MVLSISDSSIGAQDTSRALSRRSCTMRQKNPNAAPPRWADITDAMDEAEVREVVAAVESLYDDQLRPYGRILRKRLSERAEARAAPSNVCPVSLRSCCEASTALDVREEDGDEWTVLLCGREGSFVDVYDAEDVYPGFMWSGLAAYMDYDATIVLPGSRYACARKLAGMGLPFFEGYSLGKLCHIVQLALVRHKILGHLKGDVVAYCRSQSMLKDRAAVRFKSGFAEQPDSSVQRVGASAYQEAAEPSGRAEASQEIVTWPLLRSGLRELLAEASADGAPGVLLSNLKRLFRARFGAALRETALGHARLSELLRDARLREICVVRLDGRGCIVAPAPEKQVRPPSRLAPRWAARTAGMLPIGCPAGRLVRHTFIHAGSPPASPRHASGQQRARSLPRGWGSRRDGWALACHALAFLPASKTRGSGSDASTALSSGGGSSGGSTPVGEGAPCSLGLGPRTLLEAWLEPI